MVSKNYDLVLNNVRQAKSYASKWHNNIERWRRLYYGQHYNMPPKPGEHRYIDPTYTNTVDLAVGVLLANDLSWRAVTFNPRPSDASKVEKFVSSTLYYANIKNQQNILHDLLMHFLRDGGAILYTVWDDLEAASIGKERQILENDVKTALVYEGIPVATYVIDPLSIGLLPGTYERWGVVVRYEKMSVYDVEIRFGKLPSRHASIANSLDLKLTTFGVLIDYWDVVPTIERGARKMVVRHAVLFDDDEIIPLEEMENYESIPYTIGFYKPTSQKDPASWHSILQPLEDTIAQLELAINRRSHQIDVFSSLPLVIKTIGGRSVDVDIPFGSVVTIGQDEAVGFPTWSGSPPDVDKHIAFLRARAQQSGFSDVFFGEGLSAVSGYAISLLTDQNRIRLQQAIVNIENFMMVWANRLVKLVYNNAEPNSYFLVHGSTRSNDFIDLVPRDILNGYKISCKFQPEFPNDKVRKHAMATQVRGILSDARIMEDYLGVEQPDDEQMRKLEDMVAQHPLMLNYALMRMLKLRADAGDEIAQDVLNAMKNGNLPGTPGRPKEPPNPLQSPGMMNNNPEELAMSNVPEPGAGNVSMTGEVT